MNALELQKELLAHSCIDACHPRVYFVKGDHCHAVTEGFFFHKGLQTPQSAEIIKLKSVASEGKTLGLFKDRR